MAGPPSGAESITIYTEYFHPEESSTAQLLTELAVGLAEDLDVRVVTGYPSYHDEDRTVDVPARETHEGVEIRRLRATRFDKGRVLFRACNWLSFTLLACWHMLRNAGRTDRVLVLSNPPVLPVAALVASRLRSFEYAYLIYDMYPDMPVELGYLDESGLVARAWERVARAVYRDADRLVVLGDSMERRLRDKFDDGGFDAGKIAVIPNWADGEFIQPMDKADNEFAREHGTREQFTLVYSGNVGRYHDVGTAIDAIDELESRGREDVQLLVIGEGGRKAAYERTVADRGVENVDFLPFQPVERLPESLTCGDASLVAIDETMEGICVSSKLYTALAAGDPVLAVVAEGDEVARVVRESDCGERLDPGDAAGVADVLERWADDPQAVDSLGRNARECFEANYTRAQAVEAYRELFAGDWSGQGRADG